MTERRWVSRAGTVAAGAGLPTVLAAACLGGLVDGPDANEQVGAPFLAPGLGMPLGTDGIGRDVWTRLLHGGGRILLVAVAATAVTVLVSIALAVFSALLGGRSGERVVRMVDMVGVIPGLLLMLLFGTGFPHNDMAVAVAIALVSVPYSTRVLRAAVRRVVNSGFVEVSRSRGDSWWQTIKHDLLPNLVAPLATETGLRLTGSLHLASTAGFLGLGQGPPNANWGRMVQENVEGMFLNPWGVIAPATVLVVAIVSINVLTDDLSRVLRSRR